MWHRFIDPCDCSKILKIWFDVEILGVEFKHVIGHSKMSSGLDYSSSLNCVKEPDA